MEQRRWEKSAAIFDKGLLDHFENKSEEEQYRIVFSMPEELQLKLLGEASTPNDYHHTKSHPCDLVKMGRKEDGNWFCQRAKNGQ